MKKIEIILDDAGLLEQLIIDGENKFHREETAASVLTITLTEKYGGEPNLTVELEKLIQY